MHGASSPDATPYAIERTLMREFGWSWDELQNAPARLIDAELEHIAADRHWQMKRNEIDRMKRGT